MLMSLMFMNDLCYILKSPACFRSHILNLKFFFVTYTIIQSITSSGMCALHFNPSKCTQTWSSGQVLGSSRGFGALLKGLTSVVDNYCRSRDPNPQPRVTSPTLYPLGHDCPICIMKPISMQAKLLSLLTSIL